MITNRQAYKTRGFTLLELMVVIAIFTMIMAVGGPSFSRMIERNQLQAATSDLTMDILWARSEAVKRNERVRLTPSTNGIEINVVPIMGGASTPLMPFKEYESGIVQTGPNFIDFMPNGRAQITGALRFFELSKTGGQESKRCVYISAAGLAKAMTDKNDDGNCANG